MPATLQVVGLDAVGLQLQQRGGRRPRERRPAARRGGEGEHGHLVTGEGDRGKLVRLARDPVADLVLEPGAVAARTDRHAHLAQRLPCQRSKARSKASSDSA
jgi:hypothetical protein